MMKPVIYQLFVRLFTNYSVSTRPSGSIIENGSGKFEFITDHILSQLSSFGITYIWLTGVLNHSTRTAYETENLPSSHPSIVKGKAGSPYAVRDYYDVDPDLAVCVSDRMAEFHHLIERIQSAGMKVWIDFIPNHVARDYFSKCKPEHIRNLGEDDDKTLFFSPANNFYYLTGQKLLLPGNSQTVENEYIEFPARATGNDVFNPLPSKEDWYETVKLNYGVDYMTGEHLFQPEPDTWIKMVDILKFWSKSGIDGFRCDMAGMVPVAFWSYATQQVQSQYPDVKFIAEIYEPLKYRDYLESGGFDWLYDKIHLYDTLREVIQNKADTSILSNVWKNLEGLDHRMLRFIENHDEQRVASKWFCGNPLAGIPAFAVCAFMNNGPVMIYNGQEVGETAGGIQGFSGDDGRTSIFDYATMPELQKWLNKGNADGAYLSEHQICLRSEYSKILKHLKSFEVFSSGYFYDLMWVNEDVPYRRSLFAFIRYIGDQTDNESIDHDLDPLLVVISFNESEFHSFIRIPMDCLTSMGFETDSRILVTAIEAPDEYEETLLPAQVNSRGIPLFVKGYSYNLYKIVLPDRD